MKNNLFYLFIFCILFAACKKENAVQKESTLPISTEKKANSFSITQQDYYVLIKAMKSHANNVDSLMSVFAAKSKTLQLQSGKSTTATDVKTNGLHVLDIGDTTNPDVQPGGDFMAANGDASFDTVNPYIEGENPNVDYIAYGARVFTNYVNMFGYFAMRGNTIKVVLPFSYVPNGGGVFIGNVTNLSKAQINIIGPAIGTFDPSTKYQSDNIYNPDQHMSTVDGNSEGGDNGIQGTFKNINGTI